jgi:hypothetical protein
MPLAPTVSSRLDASLTQRERNRSTARALREERTISRRPQPTFPPVERGASSSPPVFPIRLRYLVLLIAAGLGLRSFGLGAAAYWQLHEAATGLANYAVCMAGPTGPQLVHARPAEFWRLVRRRIVASAADARPFAACVPALEAYAGGSRRAAHEARASDFREYGALRGEPKSNLGVADLTVSSARLTELLGAAWPFAPADLDALVRPERSTKAAPHPIEPSRPALGRGLPSIELGYSSVRASGSSYLLVAGQGANASAHRSEDGGVTWVDLDMDEPNAAALEEGCSSGDGRVLFRLRETGDQLRVDSWQNGELEKSFALASADRRLLGFACDASAALAITGGEVDDRPAFRFCPHGAPCKNLAVPPALRAPVFEGTSLSIARVKGVSVISLARAGVVRVVSSRDDGATWTPPIVAFDREEQGGKTTPTHLLGLGSKLVLFAGGRSPKEDYPTLLSGDFGASWQGR